MDVFQPGIEIHDARSECVLSRDHRVGDEGFASEFHLPLDVLVQIVEIARHGLIVHAFLEIRWYVAKRRNTQIVAHGLEIRVLPHGVV